MNNIFVSHTILIPLPEGYQVEVGDIVYAKFTDSYNRDIGYCKGQVLKIFHSPHTFTPHAITVILDDGRTRILNKIEDIYTTVELLRDTNIKRLTR
jgi:hypothetical protein